MAKEYVPSPKIKNRAESLSLTQEVLTKGGKNPEWEKGVRDDKGRGKSTFILKSLRNS